MKIYSKAQLSALARLFSASVFREMAKKGQSSLFSRLLGQTNLLEVANLDTNVGNFFESAFEVLKRAGHRDEYIYRSAISQKILMGRHSLRTASILNEFRIGNSKADVVILNGTATVYEIKSERDTLSRLFNQVEDYKRVFAQVNVIASENHVEGILKTVPTDVGVMCLSKRHQITTVRTALECPTRIDPTTVFQSLRLTESLSILQALNIKVPDVPNTQRHSAILKLFTTLDPIVLHKEMVQTLKRTRNLAPLGEFVQRLPPSLRSAALSVSVRRSDHPKLLDALSTPLRTAMTWS